ARRSFVETVSRYDRNAFNDPALDPPPLNQKVLEHAHSDEGLFWGDNINVEEADELYQELMEEPSTAWATGLEILKQYGWAMDGDAQEHVKTMIALAAAQGRLPQPE